MPCHLPRRKPISEGPWPLARPTRCVSATAQLARGNPGWKQDTGRRTTERTLLLLVLAGLILSGTLADAASGGDDEVRGAASQATRVGQVREAIRLLKRIEQPTSPDFTWRGQLLILLGPPAYEDASQAFHMAVQLDPYNPDAHYGLAQLALLRKDYPQAEAYCRKVLALLPRSAQAKNLLAGALLYQGKFEEGEALLRTLEQDPEVGGMARGNLGELYLRQGRLSLAEDKLKEALAIQPANIEWHTYLGDVYRLRGQRAEAAAEYQAALEVAGKSVSVDQALVDDLVRKLRAVEE